MNEKEKEELLEFLKGFVKELVIIKDGENKFKIYHKDDLSVRPPEFHSIKKNE